MDTLGRGMEERAEQIGGLGRDFLENFGSQLGGLGFDRVAGLGDQDFRTPFERAGGLAGLDQLGGGGFLGVFRQRGGSWWRGQNVCHERQVAEEEEQEQEAGAGYSFHMEVQRCEEEEDRYVCTHKTGSPAMMVTETSAYFCCPGFRLVGRSSCLEVEGMAPLEERMEELGGDFLDLVVEANLAPLLHNVTVFLPSDEAVEEWRRTRGEVEVQDTTLYRVDEGLLGRRRRSITVDVVGPSLEEVVGGHLVEGFVDSAKLTEWALLPPATPQGPRVRITKTPAGSLLANCAQVASLDQHAVDGLVHRVSRVLEPATSSLLEVLRADSQFTVFLSGLEAHGLTPLLEGPSHLTLLVPTDEAFSKLHPATLAKVQGGACGLPILQAHLLQQPLCADAVQDQMTINSLAGLPVLLERDLEGHVTVDGIRVIISDKLATNGIIHIIGEVILPPSSASVLDHLAGAPHLSALLQAASLDEAAIAKLHNATFFLPTEQALEKLGEQARKALVKDPEALEQVLLHHVVVGEEGSKCRGGELETAAGTRLRVSHHRHWLAPAVTLVQCARVQASTQVCGAEVVAIDRLLAAPAGDLMEALGRSHGQFARLLEVAGLDKEVAEGHFTILAPVDAAFHQLDAEVSRQLFAEKEVAEQVARAHLLPVSICCSSVPRASRLRRRSHLGSQVTLRRARGGAVMADTAEVLRCDLAAGNSLIHSIAAMEGGRSRRGWLL